MAVGSDMLASPPPSPINDPAAAQGAPGPGGAASPASFGALLGTGPGAGGQLPPGAVPGQQLQGVLQIGQGMTEQIRTLAQSVPVMAPKLMQAATLIEQALADFVTTSAAGAPPPMGGQATPGVFSAGAAFGGQ